MLSTCAAALELSRRVPAAAEGFAVSTGAADAPALSLRARFPPPDTDAGVCSPSAPRFLVRMRFLVDGNLHSFGPRASEGRDG